MGTTRRIIHGNGVRGRAVEAGFGAAGGQVAGRGWSVLASAYAAKSARWDTVSHLQGDGPVEELAKAVEEALRLRSRKATWCMVELVDELKV